MSKFTIPTVFKAVDQFSGPVEKMANNMDKFEKSAGGLVGTFGDIQRELFSFVSKMAVIGAIGGIFTLGVNSIVEYETALHSLEAVTGQASSLYKKQIESIATNTRKSAIEVTKSFEIIGSAMSEYLDNPKALGQISQAGITLSKASRMELEPALQALTSVMNQFGLSAEMAGDTINRLTAGEIVGSVSTAKTSEYLQQFGAVASANNVSLAESVALVQTLGKKIPVETLGRASRNMITFMSAVKGNAAKSKAAQSLGVDLDIISNKAIPLGDRLKELSKIQNDAAAMAHFFGEENITAGTAIFQNLKTYEEFAAKIAKTNEAEKQAAVNSNTLANAVVELKNSFINAVVSGDKLNPVMELMKSTAFFLARNMDSIIAVVGIAVGAFLAYKAALLAVNAVMMLNEAFLTGKFIVAMIKQVALTNSTTFATAALAVAQETLNAAWLANPVGIVIAGVAALGIALYGLYKIMDRGTAQEQAAKKLREKTLENSVEQRAEATALFSVLRKTAEGSKAYNDTLAKLEQMQPGIIDKYGLQVKSIEKLNEAEKDLISNIMKRAEAEAAAEIVREKARAKLEAEMAAKGPASFGTKILETLRLGGRAENLAAANAEYEAAVNQQVALNKEAEIKGTMEGNINLNVNDPTNRASVTATPGINIKQPTTTSTTGF